jgi:DNA-binding SARP family transcriptional activator
LALLLMHSGDVVSRDRLIEELWAGAPPASASQSLDAYVSRLRRAFREAGANDVLATRAPGYVLNAPSTDARSFESLVGEARAMLAAGDAERGVERLGEALALWPGAAYPEVADQPWARAESGRLEELRLAATEDRIEGELALGRHAALVAGLEVLAARHPERERVVGQLMLALYRSGRQAEALAAYRAARRGMVSELGLEPGRDLRRLESAVLAQDPSLDAPARRRRRCRQRRVRAGPGWVSCWPGRSRASPPARSR